MEQNYDGYVLITLEVLELRGLAKSTTKAYFDHDCFIYNYVRLFLSILFGRLVSVD